VWHLLHHYIAGQRTVAANVAITVVGDALRIQVTGVNGWGWRHLHIYVGTAPVPVGNGGVAFGRFPFQIPFSATTTQFDRSFALSPIAVCGSRLNVVIHGEMIGLSGFVAGRTETGLALGQVPFPGSRWGWSIQFNYCCSQPVQPEQPPVRPPVQPEQPPILPPTEPPIRPPTESPQVFDSSFNAMAVEGDAKSFQAEQSGGLSTGSIVAIVLGAFGAVLLAVVIAVFALNSRARVEEKV